MSDLAYFQQMAAYNSWANQKLYEAAQKLSPEEFHQDCDVFFKSMCGTLNHLLVGDYAWYGRLIQKPRAGLKLDDVLYEDFSALKKARIEQDQLFINFCAEMTAEFLAGDLSYQSITAGAFTVPVRTVLGHVFNHQTHHRGHAHAILSRLGYTPPDIDLIYFALGR